MSIRRAAAALLLSVAAVVAAATPAFAQTETELDASSPHEGSMIAGPRQIVLSFTGHVTLPANPITVTGGNGASWTVGEAKAVGPLVTAPVVSRGPVGPYTLSYRVIAEDGDAVTGSISFTLIPNDSGSAVRPQTTKTPPSTASSQGAAHGASRPHGLPGAVTGTASTSDSGGIPVWVWILGAIVVLAIGVLEAVRVGRSSRS